MFKQTEPVFSGLRGAVARLSSNEHPNADAQQPGHLRGTKSAAVLDALHLGYRQIASPSLTPRQPGVAVRFGSGMN